MKLYDLNLSELYIIYGYPYSIITIKMVKGGLNKYGKKIMGEGLEMIHEEVKITKFKNYAKAFMEYLKDYDA